jgi:y4mF family transcriptional regulator
MNSVRPSFIPEITQTIVQRRMELGLKQADLARLSGVSVHCLSDLETGKGNPTLRSLEQLLDVLGLELRAQPHKLPLADAPTVEGTP